MLAGAAASAACVTDRGRLPPFVPGNPQNLSAVEATGFMRNGNLSAEHYATVLLNQCERLKSLNAFITLDRDQVLSDARAADERRKSGAKLGPLHGLPIPIKDSVNTKDLRTTAGTPALRSPTPGDATPPAGQLLLSDMDRGSRSVKRSFNVAESPGASSSAYIAAIFVPHSFGFRNLRIPKFGMRSAFS